MPFAQFSIKLQQMFNLYREHDQELTNNSKLQHPFRKIQCSDLSHCVASLESEHNLHHLTFDKAINHITTILSRLQSSSRLASIESIILDGVEDVVEEVAEEGIEAVEEANPTNVNR